jgi:hypothetical protein
MVKRSSLHFGHVVEPEKLERREELRPQISSVAASISSLPTEIITVILQNVGSHKDLKHIRLVCKRLAPIAAECLFEEVIVVPHEDSFERLLKLSDHTTLSSHVKCLVYDTRTMLEPEDVQLEIDADPILKLYWEVPSKRLRLRSFLKYHNEHTFRTVEQTGREIKYLLRLFKSLPSLKAIDVKNVIGSDTGITGLPRFYQRMGNHMGQHHNRYFSSTKRITHRTRSVLLCAYVSCLKLDRLRLEGVNWNEMFSFADVREESRYFKVLSENLSVRLAEKHACGEEIYSSLEWGTVLSRAIDCLLNRKSLDLRFGNVGFWSESSEDRSLLSKSEPLPCHLPMLQALRLEEFTATADDLVDFILGHCDTLTSLTILDARLLKKADQPRACWVNVIRRLQQGLRLEKASVEGILSNGGKHYWLASASDQLGIEAKGMRSLKGQVEDFLVRGGQCPLDRAVLSGVLTDQPKQPLWRGDKSFFLRNLYGHGDYDDDT